MDSDPESQHVIDTPNDPMDEDNPQKETLDNVNASEEVIDAAMQKPTEYNPLQALLSIGDPIFDTISKTDGIIQSSTNEVLPYYG
ncbi:predicted protein [Arabidopsis lyrata subsp. lyrata]|uniref:Predicted protein n=1 Tax=Arabidopsis lyrata subsp. lyrata TaxID=81972 RepID=D7LDG7_ARALL|nr:predicted protein [Arabidopsis lyrata subsp. lyrata]